MSHNRKSIEMNPKAVQLKGFIHKVLQKRVIDKITDQQQTVIKLYNHKNYSKVSQQILPRQNITSKI